MLDADPRNRALVEEILTAERYRVSSTGDTATASLIVRSEAVDFVLADMGMGVLEAVPRWERRRSDPVLVSRAPVASGYAVLRAFHSDPRAARYPAVYLKGDSTADRSQTVRFGVIDYVPKPIDAGMLCERVEDVFLELEPPSEPAAAPPPSAEAAPPAAPPRPPEAAREPAPAVVRETWSGIGSAEGLAAPAIEALPKGLRTALLVDADAESRRFLRSLLTPYEFTILEAESCDQGLEIALAERPWMILTEVNMPGMDGFEFCRRVRAQTVTRHTPLIFYSAWDDYRERYLGMKLGADDYLSKSAPPREVLIRIQLILKRYSDVGTRTRRGAGLQGGIEVIGAPGMLQMCHLGRLSGACTVRSGTDRVQFRFREGEIVAAELGRVQGAKAVFEFISWTQGDFEFVPGDPGDAPPLPEAFDFLLLEGCRLLDEQLRLAEADTDHGVRVTGDRRSGSA